MAQVAFVGKPGFDKYIAAPTATKDTAQDVSIGDIDTIRPCWWLLSDDQVLKVQQLTAYALEKVQGTQLVRKTPADGPTETSRSKKANVTEETRMHTSKAIIMCVSLEVGRGGAACAHVFMGIREFDRTTLLRSAMGYRRSHRRESRANRLSCISRSARLPVIPVGGTRFVKNT